jgi:hypothetical protein
MRNLLLLFCISFVIASCDDGDIITVELDFDQTLALCDENNSEYLLYDVRTDPAESLSLVFPRNATNDLIFNPTVTPYNTTIDISNSVLFNYRTYNQEPSFCNVIPDPNVVINEDYPASSGQVNILTVVTDSDNDGISNADEGADPNGDGDFSDSLDTDSDGIFDYIDQDDDNDNVFTIDEDDNTDNDDNPFTDARDTDNNGTPDYLDSDDDGDGILTRLEDENENQILIDDFQEVSGMAILPRFLDNTAVEAFADVGFVGNSFTRTFTSTFTIINAGIEILSATTLNFGTYIDTETIQN